MNDTRIHVTASENLTDVVLRADVADRLDALGVRGEAAQAILKETAPRRHQLRCKAAMAAAHNYIISLLGECVFEVEPLIVLLADMLGVEGSSTLRHSGLHKCGKGRKQAADGPAWTAAIEEAALAALKSLGSRDGCRGSWAWSAHRNDDLPYIAIECVARAAGREDIVVQACGIDCIKPAWALTIAREGLRRSLGLPAWHPAHPVGFRGEPRDWADVVNHLVESDVNV